MKIAKHFLLSTNESQFIKMRRQLQRRKPSRPGRFLLVEAETDLVPGRLIELAGLIDSLGETRNLRALGFEFSPGLEKQSTNLYHSFASWVLWRIPFSRPKRLLGSVGVEHVLLTRRTRALREKSHARLQELLACTQSKMDILEWSQDGVQFGDLLYDHYLRCQKLATLDFSSPQFQVFARKFLAAVLFWIEEFARLEPAGVAVENVEYGPNILMRIANLARVPALRLSIDNVCAVTKESPNSHQLPFESLRNDFKSTNNKTLQDHLLFGATRIANRLKGEIDHDISYLPVSQFTGGIDNLQIEDSKMFNVLVAPHCFWESVNVFGKGLFPDFWEWLCFIGELSGTPGLRVYVKEHPNFLPVDRAILEQFLLLYPKVHKIDGHVGHHALVRQGIDLVLTDHGTIGTEYPALGVPVLTATSRSPYRDWGFTIAPKTIPELQRLILGPPRISASAAKGEIAEYFAAVRWRTYSESCFFFPEVASDGFERRHPRLLEQYLKLHSSAGHELVKRRVDDFISFVEENPTIATYQTSESRHRFDG